MTQLFHSSSPDPQPLPPEKRNLSGQSTSSIKPNSSNHFPERIRNFFRISVVSEGSGHLKTSSRFRQSRFLGGITKSRSIGVANEENPSKDRISPAANADLDLPHEYTQTSANQNKSDVSLSPQDPPPSKIDGAVGVNGQAGTTADHTSARKLRRVASAPGTQGLFQNSKSGERPSTADLGKVLNLQNNGLPLARANPSQGPVLPLTVTKGILSPGQMRQSKAFPRTYSSNSIKVKDVEVGPGSFDKIKIIGKGDVGKVYLVQEKKSSRFYAMKGLDLSHRLLPLRSGADVS